MLVMSGSTAIATQSNNIVIDDEDGTLADGNIRIATSGSARVYFTIADVNNQQMPAGTTVSINATGASVTSTSDFTWPSTNYNGGRSFSVSLRGGDQPDSGNLIVTVTTPGVNGSFDGTTVEVVNLPIVVE